MELNDLPKVRNTKGFDLKFMKEANKKLKNESSIADSWETKEEGDVKDLPSVPCFLEESESKVTKPESYISKKEKADKKNILKNFKVTISSSDEDEKETIESDDGDTTVQFDENGKPFKEKNLFNSKTMRNKFLSKILLRSKKKIVKYGTCVLTPFILAKLAVSVF